MGRVCIGIVMAAFAGGLIFSPAAEADQWNDTTILTFSEPVMVPHATLPPGTYVFKLADIRGNRHLVQIYDKEEERLISTTQAVPTRRQRESDDVIVRFNPTTDGGPVAIQSWFTVGSTYGHEFVYPEEQARQIADRTKTVVLSVDVPDSDLQRGTLRTISPGGRRTTWEGDAAVLSEWSTWQKNRAISDASAASGRPQSASATLVQTERAAPRVRLDDIESQPRKYFGQRVSVDAEIEEVFGPRLFTIDEPNWGDLDGEILVFMPTALAAAVRENDRVTISGMLQPFAVAEVEREWGWLGLEPEVEVEFTAKPVLRAEKLVGGNNDRVLMIQVPPASAGAGHAAADDAARAVPAAGDSSNARPAGTSGKTAAASPIVEVSTLTAGDDQLVGRSVSLQQARVVAVNPARGYFVSSGSEHIFVLPAAEQIPRIGAGEAVRIDGTVLQMPDDMGERLNAPGPLNDDIYVYATHIRRR